jgi:hypothetical protein
VLELPAPPPDPALSAEFEPSPEQPHAASAASAATPPNDPILNVIRLIIIPAAYRRDAAVEKPPAVGH